ncbi:hypothetical protein [Erwinia pyrifoliae]
MAVAFAGIGIAMSCWLVSGCWICRSICKACKSWQSAGGLFLTDYRCRTFSLPLLA